MEENDWFFDKWQKVTQGTHISRLATGPFGTLVVIAILVVAAILILLETGVL